MFCYIYKIIKNDAENDDMIYIGSSCNPDYRWLSHKCKCNNPESKEYNKKVYKYINDNGGIDEWKMIILDEYEIPLKYCVERNNYEKDYIIKYDAINKLNVNLTGITRKQSCKKYYDDNKEKYKDNYQKNADKIKEKHKEYYENNKNKIKEYKKEKIICSNCGALIRRSDMARHKQTDKCTNFNTSSS